MTLANPYFIGTEAGNVSPAYLNAARGRTAGGVYMAQLGAYQFALETAAFDTLQRATQFRWAPQNRIGRAPAQQFMGIGEDTIELAGSIYPHFRGGLWQLDLMRAAAGAGDPLPLIYAFNRRGQYAGLWCIKTINDNRSIFFRDGAARKIDFTLSLVAYGEDEDVAAAIQQKLTQIQGSAGAAEVPALTSQAATALLENSLAIDLYNAGVA